MEVITTHINTDFDGFAGVIAARKLYPGAEIVLGGNTQPNVRNYMALYRDVWFPLRVSELPPSKLKRLVLVDTANPARLGNLRNLAEKAEEIHVYDHHPSSPEDVKATSWIVEPLGATVTILVELLKKRGLPVDPLEATLFCLGIYEDTGSLTFPATTPRDVEAVAFLLRCGANLNIVASYLGYPLTPEQKKLLQKLLEAGQLLVVNGVRIFVTKARVNHYIRGLDLLTQKIGEIEDFNAVFTLAQMRDRVYLVARSKTNLLRVNEILEAWQGGGHEQAASAMVRGTTLDKIEQQIYDLLCQKVQRGPVARDLMVTPVKTITPLTSLREAGEVMLRYGHSGLPVVEGGRLVGFISRRDVDKARQYGLEHAPVKGYMSRQIAAIDPETTLAEIQQLLVKYDIGRLPVLDQEGQILGIVSRSDLLRVFHQGKYFHPYQTLYLSGETADQAVQGRSWNILGLMKRRLPEFLLDFFREVGTLGEECAASVYLAGDFVRDLMRGEPGLLIELVVEGDFVFMRNLELRLKQPVPGGDFPPDPLRTVFFRLPSRHRLMVNTARAEFHEYPAAKLKAERSSLRQDLYRRDFTINTLAVGLNPSCFAQLFDFFGGQRDLLKGLIRVLHNFSFVEDPLRVLRALRFEQALGYRLEKQTQALLENAVAERFLERVSPARIKEELKICLQKKNAQGILCRFENFNLWDQIGGLLNEKDTREILNHADSETRKQLSDYLRGRENPESEVNHA
ncbi:MAG: CBS domain-containing protein [Bacillota bacterium]|nr:CBS domain-containing protein [Bacillota bacterium]